MKFLRKNNPGNHRLKLKVDTGAQRNTLPLRIISFNNMFPEHHNSKEATVAKKSKTRLLAYNGTEIQHYGTVTFPCQFKYTEYQPITFNVVVAEGPVIAGLPTCESLKIVSKLCYTNQQAR